MFKREEVADRAARDWKDAGVRSKREIAGIDARTIVTVAGVIIPMPLQQRREDRGAIHASGLYRAWRAYAGRWCIGHIAWSPCTHVHSTRSADAVIHKTIGAAVSPATWLASHMAAIGPRMRRSRVIRDQTLTG